MLVLGINDIEDIVITQDGREIVLKHFKNEHGRWRVAFHCDDDVSVTRRPRRYEPPKTRGE